MASPTAAKFLFDKEFASAAARASRPSRWPSAGCSRRGRSGRAASGFAEGEPTREVAAAEARPPAALGASPTRPWTALPTRSPASQRGSNTEAVELAVAVAAQARADA